MHISSSTAVPEQALRAIRQLIEEQGYGPGDVLPSQRELAERLGVSRASLREALSSLSAMGIVTVQPGKGIYVRAAEPVRPGYVWSFGETVSAADTFQLRYAVEGFAAGLAATQLTRDDIDALEDNVERMRRALRQGALEAAAQLDFAFHQHLLRASGNMALHDIIASRMEMFLESQRLPFIQPERAMETWQEHKRILRALARQSATAARRAMQDHVRAAASRTGIVFATPGD